MIAVDLALFELHLHNDGLVVTDGLIRMRQDGRSNLSTCFYGVLQSGRFRAQTIIKVFEARIFFTLHSALNK